MNDPSLGPSGYVRTSHEPRARAIVRWREDASRSRTWVSDAIAPTSAAPSPGLNGSALATPVRRPRQADLCVSALHVRHRDDLDAYCKRKRRTDHARRAERGHEHDLAPSVSAKGLEPARPGGDRIGL